ncbi:regulator SirB [Hahella sp. CCB-MM4]|uniref:SirB2 family protein n=1 Tax=Hahella sp. (strain CCB-MM4) TaxID=1926491 RepID=UPI000B9B2207|nr:SirB2 family protein [Hahella sp. CCB-MM4]OZG72912.1 regulator SirB [Hahella sp. CCB-MM4]
MTYSLLKSIHLICVTLTILLFTLRYYWMLTDNALLLKPLVRVLPHIVDTLLLLSAIGLALLLVQYPLVNHWLTAKVIGLVGYIVLGTVALKRGKTKRTRAMAGIGAYLCVAYIISVAVTKNPWLI